MQAVQKILVRGAQPPRPMSYSRREAAQIAPLRLVTMIATTMAISAYYAKAPPTAPSMTARKGALASLGSSIASSACTASMAPV